MEKEINILNSGAFKFCDFARSIENIPREYQSNDWFVKLRELDAKIHTKGLQDKITFSDDRLVYIGFQVMAQTNASTTITKREWFLVSRYLELYTDKKNPPPNYDELKSFIAMYINYFNSIQMDSEQIEEYKSLGAVLNNIPYDFLPNFVLDAFASAESGDEIETTVSYEEPNPEIWVEFKHLCEAMIESGEDTENWKELLYFSNYMLTGELK